MTAGSTALPARRPSGWLVAAVGGVAVVATTALPWHQAVTTTETAGPILAFLIAMTVLAGLSDRAGLFDSIAARTARLARGSTPALVLIVCVLLTAVTAALSLDTTAVLMTPVVLSLCASVDVPPVPFALATIWLANAASLLLPVSNLTNLLATDHGGYDTVDFAARMALPELTALVVVLVVLALRFGGVLRGRHRPPVAAPGTDRLLLLTAGGCCAAVAPAALLGVPPWQVAAPAAAVLAGVSAVRNRTAFSARLVPWRLVVLTEGLFLVVAAADRHGLGSALQHLTGHRPVATAAVGAGLSNLTNNLPAYLAVSHVLPPGHTQSLALLIGTDAGPLVVVWGSLATLLWRERCRERGVEISAATFTRYGLIVTPLLVAACLGALLIR